MRAKTHSLGARLRGLPHSGTATHPSMAQRTSIDRLVTCSPSLAGTWAEGRFEAALLYLLSPQLARAGHQQQRAAFPPALAAWRLVARARPPLVPRVSAAARAARRRLRQRTKRQTTKQLARRWCSRHWCSRRRRRRATQRGTAAPVTAMGMPLVAVYQGVQCANRTAAAPKGAAAVAAAYIGDDAAVGERGARARLALAVVHDEDLVGDVLHLGLQHLEGLVPGRGGQAWWVGGGGGEGGRWSCAARAFSLV